MDCMCKKQNFYLKVAEAKEGRLVALPRSHMKAKSENIAV